MQPHEYIMLAYRICYQKGRTVDETIYMHNKFNADYLKAKKEDFYGVAHGKGSMRPFFECQAKGFFLYSLLSDDVDNDNLEAIIINNN